MRTSILLLAASLPLGAAFTACGSDSFNDTCVPGYTKSGDDCVPSAGGASSGGSAGAGGGVATGGSPTGGNAGSGGAGGDSSAGGQGGDGGHSGGGGSPGGAGGASGSAATGGEGGNGGSTGGSAGASGGMSSGGVTGFAGSSGAAGKGGHIGGACTANTATCATATSRSVCSADGTKTTIELCMGDTSYCTSGLCVACTDPSQCDTPANKCLVATCNANLCGTDFVKMGAPLGTDTAHDCQQTICDGKGGKTTIADGMDTPVDDGNTCTDDVCDGTNPVHPYKDAGATCGAGVCNGAGVCGVCKPGDVRCFQNGPQVCDSTGEWTGGAACSGAEGVCSAGACVGVVKMVAAFDFTCAVLSDGVARCWGQDGDNLVGLGNIATVKSPAVAVAIGSVVDIALSGYTGCAATTAGSVLCWGANDVGQLGNGTQNQTPGVAAVPGVTGAVEVSVSANHSCAKTPTAFYCWGDNSGGELGDGFAEPLSTVPIQLGQIGYHIHAASTLSSTGFSCLEKAKGLVSCWGGNAEGEIATGDYANVGTPKPTAMGAIGLGAGFACATGFATSLQCWGSNNLGQVGAGSQASALPAQTAVAGPISSVQVSSLAVGEVRVCVSLVGGEVRCWGANADGQLGTGTPSAFEASPVSIPMLTGFTGFVFGDNHTCGRAPTGEIMCWGRNKYGQLGDATTIDHAQPALVKW